MACFVLRGSMLRKILPVAACTLASLCLETPMATAQRGHTGGHVGSGVRTGAPPVARPPGSYPTISEPRVIPGPRPARVGAPFLFPQRPIIFVHRGFFFGAPFFRLGVGPECNSLWWPNCSPFCAWGFSSNPLPFTEYASENYVTLQPYEVPVYLYGGGEHERVWLYLKDGTAYGVADYWFVNGRVHFIAVEEGGAKSAEHVIGFDELDLQKTVDVNTRRGFRVVMRDEPLDQYLRDHPDPMPPLLQLSPKN